MGRRLKRVTSPARHDWRDTARECGFQFHTIEGDLYWDESVRYEFSLSEIERDLEDPTQELHGMCMDLVDQLVREPEQLAKVGIPSSQWDFVCDSWKRGDPHLYGRMDFSYDGQGPAKLLELNYDTPTSLYEASFFQWVWMEQMRDRGDLPQGVDQYNRIHEDLLEVMSHLRVLAGPAHPDEPAFVFTAVAESDEDRGTTQYLQDLANQSGFPTRFLDIFEIGVDSQGRFTDTSEEVIQRIFKLYPWEWLFAEDFAKHLATTPTAWLEPPWKAILSNKGVLPFLWQRHPGHPNLLEAHFEERPGDELGPGWVRKPVHSREGANIRIRPPRGAEIVVDGPYGEGPAIRQAYHPLPNFDGRYALVGSWVIGDRASGIGMREDSTLITRDTSRFVPHVIL